MAKRQCECCLNENDLIHTTDESANLIYLCFSIRISSHSSDDSLIFICNMCCEKLKDCNEFRCQILESQIKLNEVHAMVTPKIESDSVVFKCESIIKEEIVSDLDDSMDADSFIVQNKSCNSNNNSKSKDELKTESNQIDGKSEKRLSLKRRASGIKKTPKKSRGMSAEKEKNYRDCLQYISNKDILDCGICGKKLSNHNLLASHMAVHYPNFTCETCGKSFLLKKYYQRHMKTHEEKRKVQCTVCNKDVESSNLQMHMKAHSGFKQTFTCTICAEKFESRIQRIKHMEQAHNVDIYKHHCNFCSKIFNRSDALNEHIHQHHKSVSTVTIEEASSTSAKMVKSRAVLRREKKYAEILPFQLDNKERNCRDCSETFASYKALVSHLAIHYPNFVCDTCGKPFLLQQHLSTHVKIHEGENVSCTICKKVLKSYYLPEHMKIHSGKTKRTKCPHCGERFESHHQRLKHMEKFHDVDIYKHHCNFCSMKFYLSSHMKSHIRRCHFKEQNISCNVCGKGFFATNELKDHIVTHTGEKNFTCDICSKSYTKKWSLVMHMRTHGDNAKKYKCLQCDKEFTQNGSLNIHMKNMH